MPQAATKNKIAKEVTDKLPRIKKCLTAHGVVQAFLFGSAASDTMNGQSDVDFLVSMDESLSPLERGRALVSLYAALEKIIDRKVDVIQIKNLKNPYFIQEIEKTKIQIHGEEYSQVPV